MVTKTDLSPSARKVLERAVSKDEGFLFVNSGGLLGGPAIQVRKSLLKAGLIEPVPHTGKGDLFDGKALRATETGFEAVGALWGATQVREAKNEAAAASDAGAEVKGPSVRANTKTARLIAKLREPEGATVDELCNAFGWLPHTTRAAISILPKKDPTLKPTSEKVDGRGRVYRLAA